jgi:hypothetical protein
MSEGRRKNREHNLKVEYALQLVVGLDMVLESLGIEANLFEELYMKILGKKKSM